MGTRVVVDGVKFYIQACCRCGIRFGVSDTYDDQRREDTNAFYCPNGHSQSYKETTASRLRKTLEVTRLRNAEQSARAGRAERRAVALKGHNTRLRNKLKRGPVQAPTKRKG